MAKPRGDLYVVTYATVVCMLCGLLLATTASVLK